MPAVPDYAAASGTLTWDANDTSIKLITVTLTPDAVDEADESFTVQLAQCFFGDGDRIRQCEREYRR